MTLMRIGRAQSPAHKGNFLQGGKSKVSNINHHQNANNRRNSCSPPFSKNNSNNNNNHNNNNNYINASKQVNNNLDGRKLERISSDPSSNDRRGGQSSRYKTELCRPFEESGVCKYGDKCQFAHGKHELRQMTRHPKYKTELCRTFHSTGLCPYGPRCHFIHNSEQTKNSMITNLSGSNSPPYLATRSLVLNSLGSEGDLSPPSSNSGSPTESKCFDDMYKVNQVSSLGINNGYVSSDFMCRNFYPEARSAFNSQPDYDYVDLNVVNERLLSNPDNFPFRRNLDLSANLIRLPVFSEIEQLLYK